jgi:alanine or glycine:cation symporter, AGCS family
MTFLELIPNFGTTLLTISFIFLIGCCLISSIKTKFIQLRVFAKAFKMFFLPKCSKKKEGAISPHQALFTSMSTTIGLGTIVGPVVAIRLGGPGALLGLLIALFLGASMNFSEIYYSFKYRKKIDSELFLGGPMPYITSICGTFVTHLYSISTAILMVIWSMHQSNTLSILATQYSIHRYISASAITIFVLFLLISGIKQIGKFSSKMVPFMFILYNTACLWTVFANFDKFTATLKLIVVSFFSLKSFAGSAAGFSIYTVLRWGFAKGIHAGEAGLGTVTIPHSQSKSNNPFDQATIGVFGTYSVAFLCFLTGMSVLITGSWNNPSVPLGIDTIREAFALNIPGSTFILTLSIFLIAIGTILGNSYNGSQCFLYVANNKSPIPYYILAAIAIFTGSIINDVEMLWGMSDYFVIPAAVINSIAVIILLFKHPIKEE